MPRPALKDGEPTARERMQSAFWECLAEMPFDRITVRDIVSRAGVNRNSYYYHYDDMFDLAENAVSNTLVLEFAHVLIDGEPTATRLISGMVAVPDASERFDRLRLLAGPNGSQRLLNVARCKIVGEWLRMYGVEECDLTDGAKATISFVFGGVTSIWASEFFTTLEDLMRAMASSGLVSHNLAVLRQELLNSAELARLKPSCSYGPNSSSAK